MMELENTCWLARARMAAFRGWVPGETELLDGWGKGPRWTKFAGRRKNCLQTHSSLLFNGGEIDETRDDPGPSAACLLAMLQMRNSASWVRTGGHMASREAIARNSFQNVSPTRGVHAFGRCRMSQGCDLIQRLMIVRLSPPFLMNPNIERRSEAQRCILVGAANCQRSRRKCPSYAQPVPSTDYEECHCC